MTNSIKFPVALNGTLSLGEVKEIAVEMTKLGWTVIDSENWDTPASSTDGNWHILVSR